MGSKPGNILKAAAPLALSYFGAPYLGAALGGGVGTSTLSGALLGGLGSAISGGNPLTGAISGGLAPNIGDIAGGLGDSALGRGISGLGNDIFGSSQDFATLPGIGKVGLGNGTGISGAISGVTGGGSSSFGGSNLLSNALSAGLGTNANDEAEKRLLEAQGKALGAITPFQNTSFSPTDLQNDPGYQFQLQQGEQALARQQAAKGNYFSGQALKDAQTFGQGLAGTTYDAANTRFNNNRNFNYGVATDQAGIFGNQGNIQAQSGINNSNLLSGALAGIMGSSGISNTGQTAGRIVGYDPKTGQPIYG